MQKRSLLLSLAGLALLTTSGFGQVLFSGTYTQNFDGMGGGTTTPTGWFVGGGIPATAASTSVASTTAALSSGGSGNSGSYNYLDLTVYSGSNTLSSISSTPATTSKAMQLNLTNNTGFAIHDIDLSFTGVQWRQNTGTQILQFSYSLNGTTWTSVSDLNFTNIVNGTSAELPTARLQNLSSSISFASDWTNGSNLYLRWYLANGTAASGAYGLDNVLITIPEPQTWALLGMAGMFGLLRRRSRK